MKKTGKKRTLVIFILTLAILLAVLSYSIVKTSRYNAMTHTTTLTKETLFSSESVSNEKVSVIAVARTSTWTKLFDLNNEGLSEDNYQAYTYDFNVTNNTLDEISSFKFKLTFDKGVFLSSAWNGALEIHQNVKENEIVDTVADLREFHPSEHKLKTVTFEGENLIPLQPGDFIIYHPSTSAGAMEMPIKPSRGTVPGIIMYIAIGEDIYSSTLELQYTFNRVLLAEPLFCISLGGIALWFIAFVIFEITSAQIKKYKERHERDNEIITESIETFIGFIDAKDPYTNGHSKRVALYTKLLASEMGYSGEELDRIYYIALLHDCGKIGIPDNILGKPERLTDEEFEIIKSHTVRGGKILSTFKSLENAGEGALYHHERYDGKGYPEGLKGEDIPLFARIICVADSFDAMNTDRVYRKKLSKQKIISELETNKKKQFDPEIADIMLRLIEENKIKTD